MSLTSAINSLVFGLLLQTLFAGLLAGTLVSGNLLLMRSVRALA